MAALAPGSYLALSHLTADHLSPRATAACVAAYQDAPDQLHLRTRAEVETYLRGLDLVAPGEGTEPQAAPAGLRDADNTGGPADDSSRLWWAGAGRKA